jgi:hypothetical protein
VRNAIGDTPASSEPLVLSLSALGPNTAKPAPIVGRGLMTRGHRHQGLSALETSGAPKDNRLIRSMWHASPKEFLC